MALAGAMSTAELGVSLAEMIRQGKVHADLLHRRQPRGRRLQPRRAFALRAAAALPRSDAGGRAAAARASAQPRDRHLHPRARSDAPHRERRARGMERVGRERRAPVSARVPLSRAALGQLERYLRDRSRRQLADRRGGGNLPIFVPGWEDSTLGNIYAAHCIQGTFKNVHTVRSGNRVHDGARRVVSRYEPEAARSASSRSAAASPATSRSASSRCSARTSASTTCALWGYFCQISDSTTSYGSYSGADPNEKITWGKLGVTRRSSSSSRTRRSWRR